MPRVTPLFAGLMLIVNSATSVPFYVQEECSCQPTSAKAYTDSSTLSECQRIASQLQSSRAAFRNPPFAPKAWTDDTEIVNFSAYPSQEHRHSKASRVSGFHPTRETVSSLPSSPSSQPSSRVRHLHDVTHIPPLSEHLSNRHPRSPLHRQLQQDGYNIVCEGQIYTARTSEIIYIDLKPISILCIFFALVFACTTIIDWVVHTWMRYSRRIRLDGFEKTLYALPQEQQLIQVQGNSHDRKQSEIKTHDRRTTELCPERE